MFTHFEDGGTFTFKLYCHVKVTAAHFHPFGYRNIKLSTKFPVKQMLALPEYPWVTDGATAD